MSARRAIVEIETMMVRAGENMSRAHLAEAYTAIVWNTLYAPARASTRANSERAA